MLDYIQAQSFWEDIPDLEIVTLCARNINQTPAGADTFTAYTLFHAKRKPATRAELEASGATLLDESLAWDFYADDLVNAGIPLPIQPQISWLCIDQTGPVITGNLTSGSSTVTSVSSTVGVVPGMGAIGTGIPDGTIIQSVGSGAIVLSQKATITQNNVALTTGDGWLISRLLRHITKAKWIGTGIRARGGGM